MARTLPLKTVKLGVVNGETPNLLSYGDMMGAILRLPGSRGQQQGLSLDEVLQAVAALKTLDEAIKAKADSVTFPDDQWRTLKEKLNHFAFSFADQAIADFGITIREAKETGLEGKS